MPLDFPSNPVQGQLYSNFYYDATTGVWRALNSLYAPNFLKDATFSSSTTARVPLTVQGLASQSANLQEWKDSSGTVLANISSTGAITSTTSSYLKDIHINRDDSAYEGGQINFRRASDNTDYWSIDTYGNTSTPSLRIFNATPIIPITIDSSGRASLPYQPSFLAYSSTAYKAGGTWSNIGAFPNSGGTATATTQHNIGNHYNTSTGTFTVPIAGRYLFIFGGWGSYNGAGNRYATSFYVNSVQTWISGANTSATDSPLVGSSILLNLAANDAVTLYMYSSVTMNLGQASHNVYWSGQLIG